MDFSKEPQVPSTKWFFTCSFATPVNFLLFPCLVSVHGLIEKITKDNIRHHHHHYWHNHCHNIPSLPTSIAHACGGTTSFLSSLPLNNISHSTFNVLKIFRGSGRIWYIRSGGQIWHPWFSRLRILSHQLFSSHPHIIQSVRQILSSNIFMESRRQTQVTKTKYPQ